MASLTDPRTDRNRAVGGRLPQPRPTGGDDWPRILVERIPGRLAGLVGGAWLALGAVAVALEPAPDDPAAVPGYAVALMLVLYLAVGTMLAGLVTRRRIALGASLVGAVAFLGLSIGCPVSGHHGFGMWWLGQMTAVLALVGLSAVALATTRSRT